MNFFRKIFFKPKKSNWYNLATFTATPSKINRYPENAEGDFYVENEACIACGAPEAEGQGFN